MTKNLENWQEVHDKITVQYVESSSADVKKLNDKATAYYQRLSRSLSTDMSRAVPLSFLDNSDLAELIVVGKHLPPLLRIPNNDLRMATLAYGAARAFLHQYPEMLAEVISLVQKRFPDKQAMIVFWLSDIVAKLIGLALLFQTKAVKDFLSDQEEPQIEISGTEITPTLDLIIPYIGLEALRSLFKSLPTDEETGQMMEPRRIEEIEEALNKLLADYLDKPCESLPVSISASLREVRDVMLETIRILLSDKTTLQTLKGKSLLEFLVACMNEDIKGFSSDLGRLSKREFEQFHMDLPGLLSSAQVVPLPLSAPPKLQISGVPGVLDPGVIIAIILAILGL